MEYAQEESSPSRLENDANLQNNLDDSANNSIIGKVKSRVSSILPNRFSKWFSPSTKQQNDSLNGGICGENTPQTSRRRCHFEVEEEENYEDDEDVHQCGDYKESNHHLNVKRDRNVSLDDMNDDDDDSQNSDNECNLIPIKQTKRDLNVERQPPAKKSRLNIEVLDSTHNSRHQPLLSSTPAVTIHSRSHSTTTPASRYSYQRYTHLNLYGNQSKKESAFNFGQQRESGLDVKTNTDIIDLITNSNYDHEDNLSEYSKIYGGGHLGISSRKSLNIPSSTSILPGSERLHSSIAHLKRQPLSSTKPVFPVTNTAGVPPRRTSTTVHEVECQGDKHNEIKHYDDIEVRDPTNSNQIINSYNGTVEDSIVFGSNKRQKPINGSINTQAIPEVNEGILLDSASDSGESGVDVAKTNSFNKQQRNTGFLNMSAVVNTRNSSRTSSFGNGLNFYSHLEGRKSLFSGPNSGNSNPINNSTLSLTSLNRRQFNASIYGSTSALSDSRLLNTFSPFYKGKTTYGGAAAYNKYTAGVGASNVRITPTLIRPTSSLSNLSTCNSLTNNNTPIGDNSAISSTAKRILDLINDFATPLSDAKKMASNLKNNSIIHIPPQAKARLNESDLHESRSMRLSQVRTPYSRSAVILQASGNASGLGAVGGLLPPVKELQVPTMSQLLQMKKMQNMTEKARRIAQHSGSSEYTLPNMKTNYTNVLEKDQQKHTNKIKNKMTKSLRTSAVTKDLQDEVPPVNLPNIAFPLMQSVPKIDLQINKPSAPYKTSTETSKLSVTKEASNTTELELAKSDTLGFHILPKNALTEKSASITDNKNEQQLSNQSQSQSTPTNLNTFKFSKPLQVVGDSFSFNNATKNEDDKYKFSPPLEIIFTPLSNCLKEQHELPKLPQLREGSCLDVLHERFALPPKLLESNTAEKNFSNLTPGFDNKIKNPSNEWECHSCMVRNKSDANKCVACETPHKLSSSIGNTTMNSLASMSGMSSFGQQFKKSANEWECEACMIRNKEENTKCIACETPRKRSVAAALPSIKNSFGDAFKPKSGSWECPSCMITNKDEVNECIACQTKNPGCTNSSQSVVLPSELKFGFTATGDTGFKILAEQQKISKWECDACLTRNDVNRIRCACCEQPKPGSSITNSTSTKFEFGATSASKFSFGFGNGSNAPKEEDLRKEISSKSEGSLSPPLTTLELDAPQGGFQFGNKSDTSNRKKDATDGTKQGTGNQFGVSTSSVELKLNAVPTSIGICGSSTTTIVTTTSTSTPKLSSAVDSNTPNTKFSLPSTISTTSICNVNNDKQKGVVFPVFSVATSSASSTTSGFSFGKTIDTNTSVTEEKEKRSADSTAVKAPATAEIETKSTSFVFGSPVVNSSTVSAAFVSSTLNTMASTTSSTNIKPMFSFGTNTSTVSALISQPSPALSSFTFGSNSTNNPATPKTITTTANTLFTAVTSTSTLTSTANATKTSSLSASSTTTPSSTNIFGSFGSVGTFNASASPLFGSSVNPPANNNLSTVSSSTNSHKPPTQFMAFGSKATSNVFGSFGGVSDAGTNNSASEKPALLVFGNVAPSSTTQPSQSSSSGFAFGSKETSNTIVQVTTASSTASVTSTSTTWPKNSFVFGSTAPAISSKIVTASTNENKEVGKPSVFGSFGSGSTSLINQQKTTSIFGVPSTSIGSPLSSSVTTASGPTSFSTNLFSTNSAPAATSIFGANSSGNAATPAPAFGSSPFGGTASATSAMPTFGSTAASGATFGSFGGSTSNTTTSTAEVKKPEAAFNFGAAPTTQSTSGGFNFGSSASTAKPAFNFGGSSTSQQPTFNFTGITEGTQNAPFQFNAGAAPVSNNIFAPTPTAGAQTAQQAKRKMRAPIRRR